jgi:heme oxygenase
MAHPPSVALVTSSAHLRAETEIAHRAVEALMPIDEIETLGTLADFLSRWHVVWQTTARAANGADACDVARAELAPIAARTTAALTTDLATLGRATTPAAPEGAAGLDTMAALLSDAETAWGVAYVLLGSRLGNAVVASRVRAALALPDDYCSAFLTAAQPHLGRNWNAFRGRLDAAELTHHASDEAVSAARWTFSWVGRHMADRPSIPSRRTPT